MRATRRARESTRFDLWPDHTPAKTRARLVDSRLNEDSGKRVLVGGVSGSDIALQDDDDDGGGAYTHVNDESGSKRYPKRQRLCGQQRDYTLYPIWWHRTCILYGVYGRNTDERAWCEM